MHLFYYRQFVYDLLLSRSILHYILFITFNSREIPINDTSILTAFSFFKLQFQNYTMYFSQVSFLKFQTHAFE